jgi:2-polyprenyl-6-methoxyphenol hydroxylase-like FAD-dependent oxidoreductase
MTLNCDVAITGGGIGGLTLASSLAQRSIPAMVFEQDNELRQIGAGAGTACITPGFCPALQGASTASDCARRWRAGQPVRPAGSAIVSVALSRSLPTR